VTPSSPEIGLADQLRIAGTLLRANELGERSLRDAIVPSDRFPGSDESASFGGAAPNDIQSRVSCRSRPVGISYPTLAFRASS
jgi:hypothetical protein